MALSQKRYDLLDDRRRVAGLPGGYSDDVDVLKIQQTLQCGVGNVDRFHLIVVGGRGDADHAKRLIVNLDLVADRIRVAEQTVAHRGPDHRDGGSRSNILTLEKLAAREGPHIDQRERDVGAENLRVVTLVGGSDPAAQAHTGSEILDSVNLADRFRVGFG